MLFLAYGALSATGAFAGIAPCSYDAVLIEAPDLGLGQEGITLVDVNDQGIAVGHVKFDLTSVPCVWTSAGGVKLLEPAPGTSESWAVAINENNWILVNGYAAGSVTRAFVYVPYEGLHVPIPLPAALEYGSITALGINDGNQVVGMDTTLAGPDDLGEVGFTWAPGTGKLITAIPGWASTRFTDINNSGVICGNVIPNNPGQAYPSALGVRAFVLQGGDVTIIEPPPPYTKSSAERINAAGLVGGNVKTDTGIQTKTAGLFFELSSGCATIVPPPPGFATWGVSDLNGSGIASGWLRSSPEAPIDPCIASVAAVVPLAPLMPPDWGGTASVAFSVSSDGIVFVEAGWDTLQLMSVWGGPDLTCDGIVDSDDLAALLADWGQWSSSSDLDGDGCVGGADVGVLLSLWSR